MPRTKQNMSDPEYRQAMLYLPYGAVHRAAFLGKMPEGTAQLDYMLYKKIISTHDDYYGEIWIVSKDA